MFAALALGALSAGGSLLSSIGAKQASGKQARLQMIADAQARDYNERMAEQRNAVAQALAREALTIPETTDRQSGSWVDVDGMMAAAERSGFNPVTFLNAGGMAAYTQRWDRETRTGHNVADLYKMMMPDYVTTTASQVPQQHSMFSAFGGALSAGVNAFGTQYRADQSYDLQMRKMDQALMQVGMGLSQRNGLMTAISYGGAGSGGARFESPTAAGGGLSPYAYPQNWKPGKVEVTHPFERGFIDPYVSDGQVKANRYGEPGDWLFGVDTMIHDAVRNMTGRTIREWGQTSGMNIGDYFKKGDTSWAPSVGRWWNSPTSFPNTFMRNPATSGPVTPYIPFPGANAW